MHPWEEGPGSIGKAPGSYLVPQPQLIQLSMVSISAQLNMVAPRPSKPDHQCGLQSPRPAEMSAEMEKLCLPSSFQSQCRDLSLLVSGPREVSRPWLASGGLSWKSDFNHGKGWGGSQAIRAWQRQKIQSQRQGGGDQQSGKG